MVGTEILSDYHKVEQTKTGPENSEDIWNDCMYLHIYSYTVNNFINCQL